jgi:hypothetical protein
MARKKTKTVVIAPQQKKKSKRATKDAELTRLGSALRALGSMGGATVGSMFGQGAAGAAAGSSLGATLSRWLGSGDYNVSKNSLVNSIKASGTIPMMHETGQTIVVRHKEFIAEVLSNTSFVVNQSFTINPGLKDTFPWLSRLANNYQQYSIRGMVYHYVPTSGSAVSSTNNALGSVMLQTSYRSTDDAPTSKVELLNEYWSSESVPNEPFCHPIECDPKENPFQIHYIRGGPLPSDENQLMYDVGKTYLCTSGQQAANVVLGDLWVTYEIELKKPIISSDVTTGGAYYTYLDNTTSPTFSSIFGSTAKTTTIGNLALLTQNNTITIPKTVVGTFDFWVVYRGTGVITDPNVTGSPSVVNAALINLTDVIDRVEFNVGTGSTCIQWTVGYSISKTNVSAAATITIPTGTGTGTLSRVSMLAYGFEDL